MALSPIGGKIVLEGEKEYKQALQEINTELKVNYSNMAVVTSAAADMENQQEALRSRTEALRKVQATQTKQVELMQAKLEQVQKTEGVSAQTVAKYQLQLDKAKVSLNNTTHELKGYEEALNNSGKEQISLQDVLDGVTNKLGIKLPEGARNAVSGLGSVSLETAALTVGAAALVAALAKVYEKLMDVTKEVATRAGDIGTLAQEYSITAEQVQELEYAETKLEVATGTITGSMTKLTSKIAENNDAFKELHVRTTDANGQLRDTYDVYLDTIDALGKMQNQTEADAMAQELFGKSFTSIKPLIEAGSKSIKEYSNQAKESGKIMSNETVAAMDKVYQKQVDVDAGWDAIKQTLAVKFAPAQEKIDDMLAEDLQPVLQDLAEAVVPTLADGLQVVLDIVKLLKAPVMAIAGAFSLVAGALELVIAGIDALIQGVKILTGSQSSFDDSMLWNSVNSTNNGLELLAGAGNMLIGSNANGTNNWRGGLTWVGENGPELVSLPRGSRIYNASQSAAMAGGAVYNITIDASRVQEFNDIVRIAQNEAVSIRQGVSK